MTEYIRPEPADYDSFPESQISACGMETIQADMKKTAVRLKHMVRYCTMDGMDLHMNIHIPERQGKLPLAVFIPGSAWRAQRIDDTTPAMSLFARRGFITAQIQYRPSDVAPFPAQIRDTRTALRFLAGHAEEYGIDTDRIFIWGDSSGGHTALMTAYTAGDPCFENEEGSDPVIRAVVDYYGPTDITRMNCEPSTMDHISPDSPEGMLIGGKTVTGSEEALRTVVMEKVSRSSPPTLIIHGTKDRLVPFGQSVMLFERLKEKEVPVRFICLKGADHGSDCFFDDPVYDIVEEFVKRYL